VFKNLITAVPVPVTLIFPTEIQTLFPYFCRCPTVSAFLWISHVVFCSANRPLCPARWSSLPSVCPSVCLSICSSAPL